MSQPNNRVILIGGSPRKNGNSDVLLRAAAEGITSQGVEMEIHFLRDYQYQPCVGCERCRKDKICTKFQDGMTLLYPKICSAKGLVLASPVHNYNVTAWMKAFIDRLYCFYDFENTHPRAWSSRLAEHKRFGATIGVCEQIDKKDMGFVMEAMQLPLDALGYSLVAEQRVFGVFHKGKVKQHAETLEESYALGEDVARAILHS